MTLEAILHLEREAPEEWVPLRVTVAGTVTRDEGRLYVDVDIAYVDVPTQSLALTSEEYDEAVDLLAAAAAEDAS